MFKYITSDGIFDANTHHISIATKGLSLLANKRSTSERVIGKNGNVVFSDGYDNKLITLECSFLDGATIEERAVSVREVSTALTQQGWLILDYEPHIKYFASVNKEVSLQINNSYDVFTISFEVSPIGRLVVSEVDYSWELAEMCWFQAWYPWEGHEVEYVIPDADETISISNNGNYPSRGMIILTGQTATTIITIDGETFTITGLNGTIYVDCENYIVYSGTLTYVNEMSKFTGDFLEFGVGANSVRVQSTGFVSLKISLRNQDAFI